MRFKITKASDWCFKDYKDFNSIEELREFVIKNNIKTQSCVLYFDGECELQIYDFYIE